MTLEIIQTFTINRFGSNAKGIFRNVTNGFSFLPFVIKPFPLRNPVVPSTLISRIGFSPEDKLSEIASSCPKHFVERIEMVMRRIKTG
jgi:hypothetical protein